MEREENENKNRLTFNGCIEKSSQISCKTHIKMRHSMFYCDLLRKYCQFKYTINACKLILIHGIPVFLWNITAKNRRNVKKLEPKEKNSPI